MFFDAKKKDSFFWNSSVKLYSYLEVGVVYDMEYTRDFIT